MSRFTERLMAAVLSAMSANREPEVVVVGNDRSGMVIINGVPIRYHVRDLVEENGRRTWKVLLDYHWGDYFSNLVLDVPAD